MIVVMILFFVIVASVIEAIDNKTGERSRDLVEADQQRFYDWVDENCDPITARKWKANAEVFIRDYWRSVGREYSPQTVEETTTRRERNALRKGKDFKRNLTEEELEFIIQNAETSEKILEAYEPIERSEDAYARKLMDTLGISYEEAMRRINKMNAQ